MKSLKLLFITFAALATLAFFAPARAADAVFTISDCSNDNSLRNGIATLQVLNGGTLNFTCGTATITLTSALPDITANTVIDGGGKITVSGNDTVSILSVATDVELKLKNIVLEKGLRTDAPGGAVLNEGHLILEKSTIRQSHSPNDGGAIGSFGHLTITDSVLDNNGAASGGAIYITNDLGGSPRLKITKTRFTANLGTEDNTGGAILSKVPFEIADSFFIDNKAGKGGAIAARFIGSSSSSVNGTLFQGNQAIQQDTGAGGALFVDDSTVNLSNVIMDDNRATDGGGIYVRPNGKVTVTETTLMNHFGLNGGGINNNGNTTLSEVTFAHNGAFGGGGAIANFGDISLTNVTLSANSAVVAGGIQNENGTVLLTNVTFALNHGVAGAGGITNNGIGAALFMTNVLFKNAEEPPTPNCLFGQPPAVSQFNLSSDDSCGFGAGRDSVDLKLGPLAANGGLTNTHLPDKTSPAVNGGDNGLCPQKDQRGVSRPQDGKCDVGAVEVQSVPSCTAKPSKPELVSPTDGKKVKSPTAKLDWQDAQCATKYKVVIRLGSPTGTSFQAKKVTPSEMETNTLTKGQTYAWRVIGINEAGKSKSEWRTFRAK